MINFRLKMAYSKFCTGLLMRFKHYLIDVKRASQQKHHFRGRCGDTAERDEAVEGYPLAPPWLYVNAIPKLSRNGVKKQEDMIGNYPKLVFFFSIVGKRT